MYILLKHTKKCKLNGTKINKHSQIAMLEASIMAKPAEVTRREEKLFKVFN
jgi:hypothetical protein